MRFLLFGHAWQTQSQAGIQSLFEEGAMDRERPVTSEEQRKCDAQETHPGTMAQVALLGFLCWGGIKNYL